MSRSHSKGAVSCGFSGGAEDNDNTYSLGLGGQPAK